MFIPGKGKAPCPGALGFPRFLPQKESRRVFKHPGAPKELPVLELDERLRYVTDTYLGDLKVVEAKITAVANQGKKGPQGFPIHPLRHGNSSWAARASRHRWTTALASSGLSRIMHWRPRPKTTSSA